MVFSGVVNYSVHYQIDPLEGGALETPDCCCKYLVIVILRYMHVYVRDTFQVTEELKQVH